MESRYDVALNAQARRMVGNPEHGQEFTYKGKKYRYGDQVPPIYKDPRFDIYDPFYGPDVRGRKRYSTPHEQSSPTASRGGININYSPSYTIHAHHSEGIISKSEIAGMAQIRSVTMNGGPFDGETKEVPVSQNLAAWYGQYSGQVAIYRPDANGQFQ
jgi:hypothetical protein